jgi:hypothetical protein
MLPYSLSLPISLLLPPSLSLSISLSISISLSLSPHGAARSHAPVPGIIYKVLDALHQHVVRCVCAPCQHAVCRSTGPSGASSTLKRKRESHRGADLDPGA